YSRIWNGAQPALSNLASSTSASLPSGAITPPPAGWLPGGSAAAGTQQDTTSSPLKLPSRNAGEVAVMVPDVWAPPNVTSSRPASASSGREPLMATCAGAVADIPTSTLALPARTCSRVSVTDTLHTPRSLAADALSSNAEAVDPSATSSCAGTQDSNATSAACARNWIGPGGFDVAPQQPSAPNASARQASGPTVAARRIGRILARGQPAYRYDARWRPPHEVASLGLDRGRSVVVA